MAATVTSKKVSVNIKLANGTGATGAVKTVSISLGAMNKDAFDADKVIAIANFLAPCLTKTIYSVEKVEVSDIAD